MVLPAMLPSKAVVHVRQIDVRGVDELQPFCVRVQSVLAVDLPNQPNMSGNDRLRRCMKGSQQARRIMELRCFFMMMAYERPLSVRSYSKYVGCCCFVSNL